MSRLITKIRPGGMNSDKSITGLGEVEHQEVVNLRMTKEGEWDSVSGWELVMAQFTAVKAAREFTDDRAGAAADRFILFQDGTSLKRIDYVDADASYVNGVVTTLSLPSGVSIGATATLRFFYHNGVIRITGASAPLWYSYISRNLFPGSGTSVDINIADFYLYKAELASNAITVKAGVNEIGDDTSVTDYDAENNKEFTLYYFLIYDDSQYSMLTPLLNCADDSHIFIRSQSYMAALELRIYGNASTWGNARVNGVGIVSKEAASGSYKIVDTIYFDTELDEITYTAESVDREQDGSGDYKKLDWDDTQALNGNHSQFEGYFYAGLPITIKEAGADYDEFDTVIDSITWGSDGIGVADMLTTTEIPSGIVANELAVFVMDRDWRWVDDTEDYYAVNIGCNLDSGDDYYEFVDIPAGTASINPNYTHHVIAGNRGYILSSESGEEDIIRYSPEFQFDVFPNLNLITTQVGDRDENIAINMRDDRVIIFKNMSVSQGQFSGAAYSQDIGFFQRGLYARNGHIVIDNVLYWMDQDEIWAFDGTAPVPMLSVGAMRSYYRSYISTSSFFLYDKMNNELWAVLNGKTIVYQFNRRAWYVRSHGLTLVDGFLDFSNHMIGFSATTMYDFNSAVHEELFICSFKCRLEEIGSPQFYKKLDTFRIHMKGSAAFTVTIKDPNDARTYTGSLTPSSTSVIGPNELFPDYLFRQFDVQVALTTAAATCQATIRGVDLEVEAWH